MSRVRQKHTAPEITLRKALWARGLRYRLHIRLPGSPDIAFPGKRLAVFVDGCFWHGCPLHGTQPKANREFWLAKIERNQERDKEVVVQLREMGWHSYRVWQHKIETDVQDVVREIARLLHERIE